MSTSTTYYGYGYGSAPPDPYGPAQSPTDDTSPYYDDTYSSNYTVPPPPPGTMPPGTMPLGTTSRRQPKSNPAFTIVLLVILLALVGGLIFILFKLFY